MNKYVKVVILAGLMLVIVGAVVFLGDLGTIQAETKSQADTVIAYVDVMEVFDNHPQTAAAKAELQDKASELQQQLSVELKDKDQDERQKIIDEYEAQLSQREQELTEQVIASIDEAVREVADEVGVKVVLDKQNVIYGGQDLTEQVKARIAEKNIND